MNGYVCTLPTIQPGLPRVSLVPCLENPFKVLEESESPYTAWLAPQFPVSIAASTEPVVDYALVVCLPPKDVVRIPRWSESSDGSPVAFEIVCPSLSGEEAIVPVIVEIRTPNPGNIFDIYRALRATND